MPFHLVSRFVSLAIFREAIEYKHTVDWDGVPVDQGGEMFSHIPQMCMDRQVFHGWAYVFYDQEYSKLVKLLAFAAFHPRYFSWYKKLSYAFSTIKRAAYFFAELASVRMDPYLRCSALVNVYTVISLWFEWDLKLKRTFLQSSHVWTGIPFFALLIRPVTGVYLTGTISTIGSIPLTVCRGLPDRLPWFGPPPW